MVLWVITNTTIPNTWVLRIIVIEERTRLMLTITHNEKVIEHIEVEIKEQCIS